MTPRFSPRRGFRFGLVSFFAEPFFDREGRALGHFGMMHDAALRLDPAAESLLRVFAARAVAEVERRRAETKLSYLANHDVLTDLPSRALFIDRLNQSLARANWHNVLVAVLRVDMERFGRQPPSARPGDRLMQLIAFRLRSCVRDGDTVARLGVEEFAIILVEVKSPDDVAHRAEDPGRLRAALPRPGPRVRDDDRHRDSTLSPDGDAETLIRSGGAPTARAVRAWASTSSTRPP
jgi:GGDEF domain-containing protein